MASKLFAVSVAAAALLIGSSLLSSADARRGGGGWGGGVRAGGGAHAFHSHSGARHAFRFHHGHRHAHRFHHRRFLVAVPFAAYGYYAYDGCEWLRRKALYTGSSYWWNRYNACLYGYGDY